MKLSIIFRAFFFFSALTYSFVANADLTAKDSFSPQQQIELQKIIHDYLLSNPRLVVEMIQKLKQSQADQAINSSTQQLFFDPISPALGNSNSDVTVVEFLDYQCGHCKHAAPMMQQLLQNDSNVRVVFKQLPIFGEGSEFAARAVLAAQQQGKYAALDHALMIAKPPFTREQILSIAKSVGLDTKKLEADMNSAEISKEIDNNKELAGALNIPGTPAFVVVTTPKNATTKPAKSFLVPGETDLGNLQQLITEARKQ